ncbi:peptidoglycan DD-metalloendopeptidase family protein [Treponema sp.]|uniref:peptidoglycan DD-metalloendopeptidase family protein n=1 Tax=Treponema sp. TaxID=166 RepID=UPI003F0B829E
MKKTISALVLAAAGFYAVSFDWPQKEIQTDSFFSYFGQLRGNTISSSLIFKDSSEIKAADKGKVIAVISDHSDDFGWFESALGNSIIISHNDGLSTVYSNLDDGSIPAKIEADGSVESGEYLGISGNSGWQEGESYLEFKVFDSENSSAVNPRILMPRTGKELPLSAGTITLIDSNGTSRNLLIERRLPAGKYRVYRTRQNVAVPYKTIVSVNGTTVESISYDVLTESSGKLGVSGNSHYSVKEIYPDSTRQLAGIVQLNKGSCTLGITVVNILNSASSISYKLDIY